MSIEILNIFCRDLFNFKQRSQIRKRNIYDEKTRVDKPFTGSVRNTVKAGTKPYSYGHISVGKNSLEMLYKEPENTLQRKVEL